MIIDGKCLICLYNSKHVCSRTSKRSRRIYIGMHRIDGVLSWVSTARNCRQNASVRVKHRHIVRPFDRGDSRNSFSLSGAFNRRSVSDILDSSVYIVALYPLYKLKRYMFYNAKINNHPKYFYYSCMNNNAN